MFFLNCFYYWRRRTGHKGGSVLGSRSHHQEPEIPDIFDSLQLAFHSWTIVSNFKNTGVSLTAGICRDWYYAGHYFTTIGLGLVIY